MTAGAKDELAGKNLVRLHLVPLLPRRDDLERGGGGRLARERRRDGGRGGCQRRAEEGFDREGEAGCGELPGYGAGGDGEGRGAREGEGQRHGFSVPRFRFGLRIWNWIGCGRMAKTDSSERALVLPGELASHGPFVATASPPIAKRASE